MRHYTIKTTVNFPDGTRHTAAINLDPREFESFDRLPRDREFIFGDFLEGKKQTMDRNRLADMIGKQVAAHIMQAVEGRDTTNGYTPEEWKEMNEP